MTSTPSDVTRTYPKRARLLNRAQFLSMKGQGSLKVRAGYFLAVVKPNGLTTNRLGVAVTKKIGNAVTRNRIKRVVRELFRQNKEAWGQGQDIVIIAQDGAGSQGSHLLRADLLKAATKLAKLKAGGAS